MQLVASHSISRRFTNMKNHQSHMKNCSHCQDIIAKVEQNVRDKTLLKMARKLTNDHSQVADLVQLTACKLIDKAHYYQENNFHGYAKVLMYRIFLNLIRSQKIDHKKRLHLSSVSNLNHKQSSYTSDDQDRKLFIQQIYQSLNESDRDLFMLLYKGFKHKEIAEILDMNLNTCHGRIRSLKIKINAEFA